MDVIISEYTINNHLLEKVVLSNKQKVFSTLLRSNCLVTGQPDWGTLYIEIDGEFGVSNESLLKYIISFRQHEEFHEQCIERIISDLYDVTKAVNITVYARYLRRGGIDINPLRFKGKCSYSLNKLKQSNASLNFIETSQ